MYAKPWNPFDLGQTSPTRSVFRATRKLKIIHIGGIIAMNSDKTRFFVRKETSQKPKKPFIMNQQQSLVSALSIVKWSWILSWPRPIRDVKVRVMWSCGTSGSTSSHVRRDQKRGNNKVDRKWSRGNPTYKSELIDSDIARSRARPQTFQSYAPLEHWWALLEMLLGVPFSESPSRLDCEHWFELLALKALLKAQAQLYKMFEGKIHGASEIICKTIKENEGCDDSRYLQD